jgi:hypothetical protein
MYRVGDDHGPKAFRRREDEEGPVVGRHLQMQSSFHTCENGLENMYDLENTETIIHTTSRILKQ